MTCGTAEHRVNVNVKYRQAVKLTYQSKVVAKQREKPSTRMPSKNQEIINEGYDLERFFELLTLTPKL